MKRFLFFPISRLIALWRFVRSIETPVLLVFVLYFFQGVFHNLGHPVTPALVEELGIDDYYFGLYFAAMSFGLFLGAPLWGVLGDRGHKRLYIVLGLVVYSIGQYAFAFVGDKNWMILFRFLSGFGVSASVTLILSHLIEHSPDHRRTIYLGLYQGLFVLGSSLGYFLGGWMTETRVLIDLLQTNVLRNIFLIQAVANLYHASTAFFVIGKDAPRDAAAAKLPFQGFRDIAKLDKNLLVFLISLALISLGAINVSKYIEVYMNASGLTPNDIGTFVGATGIVSIVATIVIVPLVARFKRDFLFMILIQLFSAVIIVFVFHSPELLITLYTGFMVYVVLKAVYTPLEQHYISSHAAPGQYGRVMGVRQAFFSIGLVIGPLIGGFLYDANPLYVFDFSALMFVVGFVLLLLIGRNIKRQTKAIK